LDNGSTCSFIDEELADKLGLKGRAISYQLSTLTARNQHHQGREIDVTVKSNACPDGIKIRNVWTSPSLKLSSAALKSDVCTLPHLSTYRAGPAQLLLGVASGVLAPLEVRLPQVPRQPYAERTQLGWVVRGPSTQECSPGARGGEANFVNGTTSLLEDQTRRDLDRLWNFEFERIPGADMTAMSVEDKEALKKMKESVCLDDGHYEIALPWKDSATLPNNRAHAFIRLQQVRRKLEKDANLEKDYQDQMRDYVDKGYARKVTAEEVAAAGANLVPPASWSAQPQQDQHTHRF
jgi:hypothetical protein